MSAAHHSIQCNRKTHSPRQIITRVWFAYVNRSPTAYKCYNISDKLFNLLEFFALICIGRSRGAPTKTLSCTSYQVTRGKLVSTTEKNNLYLCDFVVYSFGNMCLQGTRNQYGTLLSGNKIFLQLH